MRSIATWSPVSSISSRRSACSTVSPGSMRPLGGAQPLPEHAPVRVEHNPPDAGLDGQRRHAVAADRLRSATTARIACQSTSRKLCMGQNFGPHIEQNSADLK